MIRPVRIASSRREIQTMMAAGLRSITLAGTPAADGVSWAPRLQLFELSTPRSDRKRPVLYVHGATFASENSIFFKFGGASWADALSSAGFSVWGLDFAGYGRSERYPAMGLDAAPAGEPLGRAPAAARQIERAVRTIVAETGAARISIIAHSWGAMPASLFAGEHPDEVDRLALFAPIVRRTLTAPPPALGPWRFLTVEEQRKRFVEDAPAGEPAVLCEADFPAWADLFLESDPTGSSCRPPSVKTPNGPLADILDAWSGTLAYDPARVGSPTLIVRGAWDTLCTDADAAWLAGALEASPDVSDVKIPRATHLMHLETGRTALYAASIEFLTNRRSIR